MNSDEIKNLAQSLREVSSEYIHNSDPNLVCRWFHSSLDLDLYLWSSAESKVQVLVQQLVLRDQVIEWRTQEGLKTGRIQRGSASGGLKKFNAKLGSDLIEFDAQLNLELVKITRQLIDSIDGLNDLERHQLKQNFS